MSVKYDKKKYYTPAVFVLAVVILLSAISFFSSQTKTDNAVNEALTNKDGIVVHFLDVGQGDSEFVELPNGQCMLIDAGTADSGQTVTDYIKQCGYTKIDYLVATHPHADHIGGMSQVVEGFDIGEIYMPKVSTATRTFEGLLEEISDKGMTINTAKAGIEVYSDSELQMEFLAPVGTQYEEINNYSAVLKISYGSNSFLFTGDAEDISEEEMLDRDYSSLSADVLKVGHHGSRYSSTIDFLYAVKPEYAVISCGAGNSYGHPHSEVLDRLNKLKAQIYRTDEQGTVTVTCDGKGGFDVECEK